MKRLILILLFIPSLAFGAFTEFYCNAAAGSNLNSGSTTASSSTYSATNGAWNSGTGIFTPTSGNPSSTVNVGDFASVYTDGSTVTGFVGRVTAVSSTTITVSITAKSGTVPTTGATGISCKVGGAWLGPNNADGFPFNTASGSMTNAAGDKPRVNLKNGTTYSITASMSVTSSSAFVRYQGYTSAVGDGGMAIIDGGTSGTSYILLDFHNSGNGAEVYNLIFQNNGATGSADGVAVTTGGGAGRVHLAGCVIHDIRGNGYNSTGGANGGNIEECEFYNCNQSNTSATGGAKIVGGTLISRCFFHDNAGANSSGLIVAAIGTVVTGCVFESNGGKGVSGSSMLVIGCDFYNNVSDGFAASLGGGTGSFVLENCNFVKNGGWGVNITGSTLDVTLRNCGFGSGTQVNTSGTVQTISGGSSTGNIDNNNPVTYASGVTPWVDPANGDFRISLTAAKGAGRGTYTQTAASYAGTIAYPDIGAAQHLEAATSAQTTRVYGE